MVIWTNRCVERYMFMVSITKTWQLDERVGVWTSWPVGKYTGTSVIMKARGRDQKENVH